MNTPIEITAEKFNEIYSSEKFRNEVANAHGHLDSQSNFKYKATCSYPTSYIVNDDQIESAKKLWSEAKEKTLKKHFNDLLFCSMGMDYKPRYEDDICNFRIRTEFINDLGQQFFVEVSAWDKIDMHVDFAIDRTTQYKIDPNGNKDQSQYYNYKGLERIRVTPYTNENLIQWINKNFNCSFKNIIIDKHNISCNGVLCESPNNLNK